MSLPKVGMYSRDRLASVLGCIVGTLAAATLVAVGVFLVVIVALLLWGQFV